MRKEICNRFALILLLAQGLLVIGGCSKAGNDGGNDGNNAGGNKPVDTKAPPTQVSDDDHQHDHSGWWCTEHGIPEEVCSMCSSKAAAKFKAKGDWCKKHDRALSQCFVCNPDLKERFAAKYKAKFGKQPPEPTE